MVDEDRCAVEGKKIVAGGVGVVVPEPGMAVIADATGPDADLQLTVSNPPGDKITIQSGEAREEPPSGVASRASGPGACRDSAYDHWDAKLYNYNRWYVNSRSIPSSMSTGRAVRAMKKAATNVSRVQDACGIRDKVRGRMIYGGGVKRSVNIKSNLDCTSNDYKSVVGFGDLPANYTAFSCIWTWIQDGPNRVAHSDVRLNKVDYAWTTRVTGSCRGRYDVESTMTHERGNTFGLDDVSEAYHGNLTMSDNSNGPCQTSERSLGRGDAIGLNKKY